MASTSKRLIAHANFHTLVDDVDPQLPLLALIQVDLTIDCANLVTFY